MCYLLDHWAEQTVILGITCFSAFDISMSQSVVLPKLLSHMCRFLVSTHMVLMAGTGALIAGPSTVCNSAHASPAPWIEVTFGNVGLASAPSGRKWVKPASAALSRANTSQDPRLSKIAEEVRANVHGFVHVDVCALHCGHCRTSAFHSTSDCWTTSSANHEAVAFKP